MTFDEKNIIRRFAAGDNSLRDVSIEIHRRECRRTKQARGTPEMDFMAEVDNPCPDYGLMAMYRKKLLGNNHNRK